MRQIDRRRLITIINEYNLKPENVHLTFEDTNLLWSENKCRRDIHSSKIIKQLTECKNSRAETILMHTVTGGINMNYFNIGICDDEEIILDKILKLVNAKFKEINCDYNINKFNNPMDLIEFHSHQYFDIVFLDIDMPEMNGIDAAKNIKIKNPNTIIIFITSMDEFVYESLKVQPFRFIRKSKLSEEISEAIISVSKFFEKNSYKINVIIDKKVMR